MNFNQLVALYEAKNEKPGQRYKSAVEREGPAGMVSGPIGKSDNFELREPVSKWDFDPSKDTGESGFAAESKIWRSMLNSFGLLFNDKDFDKQVQKIAKTFNSNRDSYKFVTDLGEGEVGKLDEEAELERLEKNRASYVSKITELENDIRLMNRKRNRAKMSPGEKHDLETKMAEMRAGLEILNKRLKEDKTKKSKSYQKYLLQKEDIIARLGNMEEKFEDSNISEQGLQHLESSLFRTDGKVREVKQKLEDTVEKLEKLYERINKINENNEKANEVALDAFVNYMRYAAQEILIETKGKVQGDQGAESLDAINWEEIPKNIQGKIAMLESLASDDPNINPILGYVDKFKRSYADKGYDERELDSNVNITKMRDYNRLPFSVLMRVYNAVRSSVKSPIPLENLDVDNHKFYNSMLLDDLRGVRTEAEWNSLAFRDRIKTAIQNLAISDPNKLLLMTDLERDPWVVNPRTKLTANKKMEARVKSMATEKGLKNEKATFEDNFYKLLEGYSVDLTDYALDLMELESIRDAKKGK